ncbi:MAG: glycosyltransferase [Kiritimatiellae bacterium]|nr:glycosyltransferase [Kiritimatiellia bacterium]
MKELNEDNGANNDGVEGSVFGGRVMGGPRQEGFGGAGELTVVIPTLGRDTVVQTVRSLLAAQGGEQLEIVVAGRIHDEKVQAALAAIRQGHANVRHLEVEYATGDSSRKKNEGARAGHGEFVAFVDDDVVVAEDWPQQILAPFADDKVGLVSGPGRVPDDLNAWGRLAGLALSSGGAGFVAKRYRGGTCAAYAIGWDQVIGCNAVYRRVTFEAVGGFPEEFYPGEEMLAAWRAEAAGWGLRFVPSARVWHYPRQSPKRFWRQIWTYGATRIRLMRAGVPRHWLVLVPGLWVAVTTLLAVWALAGLAVVGYAVEGLPAGIRSGCGWWGWGQYLLLVDLCAYAIVMLWITLGTVFATRNVGDFRVWPMLWLMHIAYGVGEWAELLRGGHDLSESAAAKAKAKGKRRESREG